MQGYVSNQSIIISFKTLLRFISDKGTILASWFLEALYHTVISKLPTQPPALAWNEKV